MPWMHENEIQAISELLMPDHTMLEFGSGGSTLHFSQLVKRYVSIEHDTSFYESLRNEVGGNVTYILAPPDYPHQTFSPALERQFSTYMRAPLRLGLVFDVVLVDGRNRIPCAIASHPLMADGGHLIIHDYCKRKRYTRYEPLLKEFFEEVRRLEDTPQTMIIMKKV